MSLTLGTLASGDIVTELYKGTALTVASNNATTYTLSSVPIGPASPNRLCLFLVAWGDAGDNNRDFVSATVNGSPAAIAVNAVASNGGSNGNAIITAFVPTGTTATVGLVFEANVDGCAVMAAACIEGVRSATPVAARSDIVQDASRICTVTLPTKAGGYALACYGLNENASSISWTGATEYFEGTWNDGNTRDQSNAYIYPTVSGSPVITAQASFTAARTVLVAASFR